MISMTIMRGSRNFAKAKRNVDCPAVMKTGDNWQKGHRAIKGPVTKEINFPKELKREFDMIYQHCSETLQI